MINLDFDAMRKLLLSKYAKARQAVREASYDEAFDIGMETVGEMVAYQDMLDAATSGPAYLMDPLNKLVGKVADATMKLAARRQRAAGR